LLSSSSTLAFNGTGTTTLTAVTINVISGADSTLGSNWNPAMNYSWRLATFAGSFTGSLANVAFNASAFAVSGATALFHLLKTRFARTGLCGSRDKLLDRRLVANWTDRATGALALFR